MSANNTDKITSVPLLDLKAQYRTIRDEIRPVIDEICDSQYFIMGPKVEAFERAVAAYSGAAYAVGVSSGTDALLIALMALDIRPGDEVITSPFTFFATAGVIHRLNAVPVFVDIDPVTFNIDPARISSAVTPRTKAIIPVHLFGQMADMDSIMALSRRLGIPVIEDGAQSIGAEYKGRRCGSIGDMGCFSFFPSKNLGAFGDAGMVLTNDQALYDKLKILRVHGAPSTYIHKLVGGNFRLDAIQAAILDVKLRHLDVWSDGRARNADYYDRAFAAAGLTPPVPARKSAVGGPMARGLAIDGSSPSGPLQTPASSRPAPPIQTLTPARPVPPIKTPPPVYRDSGDRHYHIYNQYTIQAADRDALQAHLKAASIGCAVYYPIPLHLQECFSALGCPLGSFPVAEKAASTVLSLPVYPELTDSQKDFVVDKVKEFYGGV